jgi:16S rRNA G966 N2-methylase RsmD
LRVEAQRIGTLPIAELNASLKQARKDNILCTFGELIRRARPYWYKANRQRKHRDIADQAAAAPEHLLGPFALIYADPPWEFATYSEKGLERTADQHYPTLTDQEIIDFKVAGRPMSDIAADRAALFSASSTCWTH